MFRIKYDSIRCYLSTYINLNIVPAHNAVRPQIYLVKNCRGCRRRVEEFTPSTISGIKNLIVALMELTALYATNNTFLDI